jgi:hypothetical protein
MARTQGTKDIIGWQEHSLVRDLALGAESGEELAEKYDMHLKPFVTLSAGRRPGLLLSWRIGRTNSPTSGELRSTIALLSLSGWRTSR